MVSLVPMPAASLFTPLTALGVPSRLLAAVAVVAVVEELLDLLLRIVSGLSGALLLSGSGPSSLMFLAAVSWA